MTPAMFGICQCAVGFGAYHAIANTQTRMPSFSNFRTKRRAVCMVLLVWLFSLASGWANACQLQERETHRHGSLIDGPFGVPFAHVSPAHVGLDVEHEETADPGKRACLKVCDDGAQGATKLAQSADTVDAPMTNSVTLVWPVAVAATRAQAWLALPAPSPGLALRTRLARLAL